MYEQIINKIEEIINTIMSSQAYEYFTTFMANLSEEYPIFTQIVMAFLVITFVKNIYRGTLSILNDILNFFIEKPLKARFQELKRPIPKVDLPSYPTMASTYIGAANNK